MNTKFSMFGGHILFKPFLNVDNMSIFNGLMFNFNLKLTELILFNLILLTFMIPLYIYLKSVKFKNFYLYTTLVFLISGCVSSTIDRIFWNGSLDFIFISNYIVDFKDIYLFFSVTLTLLFIFYQIVKLTFRQIIRKLF